MNQRTHHTNNFESWILIIITMGFCTLAYSQSHRIGSPPIANFTKSEYRAGTQNWMIKQASNGIVYVGNNKGLLRYDGVNWKLLQMPNRTIVRSFAFDGGGRIYVGAQNEIGYLQESLFSVSEYVSLKNLVPEEFSNFEDVWDTFIKGDQVIFCTEKGVFIYSANKLEWIAPPSGRFENFFNIDGQLFFQDKKEGLYELTASSLEQVANLGELNEKRIIALLKTGRDPKGFALLENALVDLNTLSRIEIRGTGLEEVIAKKPYCAIQLADGNLAIGTILGGVFILNEDWELRSIINPEQGLPNNTVLCIYEDLQKNLWMGLDNGLSYVEISSPFRIIGSDMNLEGTGYASYIHNDTLYLGTNQGLYQASWPELLESYNVSFELTEGFDGQIWGIDMVEDDLVIDRHSGAYYLKNGKSQPISRVDGVWDFRELEHYPDYAIEGTYTGFYIYKRNYRDPNGWNLIGRLNGFDQSARIFEEDKNGDLWVSHAYRGLYKIFLGDNPTVVDSVKLFAQDDGLPSDIFNNVSEIRGEIIFSTPHGVFTYLEDKNQFSRHETLTEIIGEGKNVERFLEDELGNIWFSLDNEFGMIKVKEEGIYNDVEVRYFNSIQDALVDGFEHIYSWNPRNTIIGVEKGFIHYDPQIKSSPTFPFELFLNAVKVESQDSSIVLYGSLLKPEIQGAQFDSDQNNLSFGFIAPNYEQLNRIDYQYMLEGYDKEWSEWTTKSEKDYSNLPPRSYVFMAKARNAYGAESNLIKYGFTINPPWYESGAAKVGYFIVFFIILGAIIKFVSSKEKRKIEAVKTVQKRKLEEREAEFQERVESRENEIITLRNEKLRNEIAHKNSELASATMHLVQKGEILMKIKSDLHEVAKKAPTDLAQPIRRIERTIEADVRLDKNWERFESHFDQVHENFFKRLRQNHPELTPKDQKLCAYLRMNLTTKEIAPLLNISVRGVEISRYRLRKKLKLSPEQNLVSFILEL